MSDLARETGPADGLAVESIDAGYGAARVLDGVSITVGDGETVALLGANGNGKSTIIKCIMGLVRPRAGRIAATLDGETHDLTGLAPERIVERGIVLVPEGRRLFPDLTVEENLALGAYRRAARGAARDNMALCLETFPALADRRRQRAGSMSGGEQQMLAIARALMASPRILIVDEPSVGLAPILVGRVMDQIQALKEERGLTVLMAEQNFRQASRIADRGYVVVGGRIAFEGESADALRDNELVKRYYLGGA